MKPLSDLTDTPCNYLIERAVAQGRIPIAYTCSMVPDARLSVHPLFPVKVRAPGVEGTESADIYLSSVICSYTRSILEYVLNGRYDFCRGWIFTAACDHMRRCYDNLEYLRRPEFVYILDVPHKGTDEGIRWLADEISILAGHLADHFNVDMSKAQSILRSPDAMKYSWFSLPSGRSGKGNSPRFRARNSMRSSPRFLRGNVARRSRWRFCGGIESYRLGRKIPACKKLC